MPLFQTIELDSVDSTNRYLKDYCLEGRPQQAVFCFTKKQTAGYGQQQRSWLSNNDSATFSLAYPLDVKAKITGLMSLQIAVLLQQTLLEIIPSSTENLYLKWPNDLFNEQGKVAGILIEQIIKKDYRCLIIGIGINRHQENQKTLIDGASSLPMFEINKLFDCFFSKIKSTGLVGFSADDLHNHWQKNDYFKIGEDVKIVSPKIEQQAYYLGINREGQAKVQINQQTQLLTSGQTSLRKLANSS